MNKLTNIPAAFAPLRGGSAVAAGVPFRSPSAGFAGRAPAARRGLRCSWVRDAAGHLVCSWSEPSPIPDHSISWRGLGRAAAAPRRAA